MDTQRLISAVRAWQQAQKEFKSVEHYYDSINWSAAESWREAKRKLDDASRAATGEAVDSPSVLASFVALADKIEQLQQRIQSAMQVEGAYIQNDAPISNESKAYARGWNECRMEVRQRLDS